MAFHFSNEVFIIFEEMKIITHSPKLLLALSSAFIVNLSAFGQINPQSGFFKPGVFEKSSKQQINTSMLMMGQNMDMKMNMAYEMDMAVKPAKGDDQLVETTFKKASGKMEMAGNSQDLPMDVKSFGTFKITVDKNGVVNNVDGNTEILQSLQQTGMGGFVKDKPLSQYIFVKNTKNIGDSWTDSTYAEKMMVNHYKYVSNNGDNAVLELVSDIHMINDMEQQGMSIHQDLKGTLKGQVLVNRKNNMVVKTEGKMHLEGTMEAMGQMIPLTMDADMFETVK